MSAIVEKTSSRLIEFDPLVHTPLLDKHHAATLNHLPSEIRELAAEAIETDFHPTNREAPYHTLNTESFNEQAALIMSRHENDASYSLEAALDHSIVVYADGRHVQLVDKHAGSTAADRYILGNLESLMQAAEKVEADIIIGRYSGDELVAIMIPRNYQNYDQSLWRDEVLKQTLEATNHQYFYQEGSPARPLTQFIENTTATQTTMRGESLNLGLDIKLKHLNAINVEINQDGHPVRERELLSYIIDGIEHPQEESATSSTLSKLVCETISRESVVHEEIWDDREATLKNKIPPSLRSRVQEVWQKTSETGMQKRTLAYAVAATYERLFPEMEVLKSRFLYEFVHDWLEQNPEESLVMYTGAPIFLKDTNKTSHRLGDQIIRLTHQILKSLTLNKRGHPPIDIICSQHRGTLISLTTHRQFRHSDKLNALQPRIENGEVAISCLDQFDGDKGYRVVSKYTTKDSFWWLIDVLRPEQARAELNLASQINKFEKYVQQRWKKFGVKENPGRS